MAKDFSSDQGGIQSSDSTIFDQIESTEPVTGFVQAAPSELAAKGPGPGVGKNTTLIR
jgi:hypothetical protein